MKPPGKPAVRRPPRGPFTRWPRASDALLSVGVFVAAVLLTDAGDGTPVVRPIGDITLGALVVTAAASGALYRRRHEPVAMLTVTLAAAVLALTLGYGDLSGIALVLLYSVGHYAARDLHSYLAAGAVLGFVVTAGLVTGRPPGTSGSPAPRSCSRGTSAARCASASFAAPNVHANGPPSRVGSWPRRGPGSPASFTTWLPTG